MENGDTEAEAYILFTSHEPLLIAESFGDSSRLTQRDREPLLAPAPTCNLSPCP